MGDGNKTDWGKIFGFAATAVAGTALAVGAYAAYNAAQQTEQSSQESQHSANSASYQSNVTGFSHIPPSPRPSHVHSDLNRRSVGDIREKHEAAAPYYFFLSSATDSGKTSSDPLSLQFSDILDPSLGGPLKSSLQLNFVLDYKWLMSQYRSAGQYGTPITLIYGQRSIRKAPSSNFDDFVTSVQITHPSSNGLHHTKMCVLEYEDGSVRVCVHTGNLNVFAWDNCVQGVWLSPLCPALPHYARSDAGESPTYFKRDLIEYLSAYRLPELQPWIGKLRGIDFRNINVFFVASPGSCEGLNSAQWGLSKLSGLLNQHAQSKSMRELSSTSWQIIAQCSTIGSLGSTAASWFNGELRQAMSQGLGVAMRNVPSIRVVYPSAKNVKDSSHGGYCLTYSENTHNKQVWLQDYLNGWKCDKKQRTKIMPHIKTYTCVSRDNSELAWFLLTSSNLSKPAWCCKTEMPETGDSMPSFEAGVLFLPKFVTRSSAFPIKQKMPGYVPVFPMPYDLPLTEYSYGDKPYYRNYKSTDNCDAGDDDIPMARATFQM